MLFEQLLHTPTRDGQPVLILEILEILQILQILQILWASVRWTQGPHMWTEAGRNLHLWLNKSGSQQQRDSKIKVFLKSSQHA